MMRKVFSPIALALVLVAVLVAAAGVFDGPTPSRQSRVAALQSTIKCPSCEGLSVAQSNAPSAVAVRERIAREVAKGSSDAEIRDGLVATYGSTILLVPPKSGLTLILWIGPLLVGLGGLWLIVRTLRRSRDG
jgi:cytochrome c-type biogenesis protein CcmH